MGPWNPLALRASTSMRSAIRALACAAVLLAPAAAAAQSPLPVIRVQSDDAGMRLQVDGRDFFVKGVNWDYFPIGTNYSYSLWTQTDDIVPLAVTDSRWMAGGCRTRSTTVRASARRSSPK